MALCWLEHLCLGHDRPSEHQLHCLLARGCHQQNQAQRLLVARNECDQICSALILVLMAVVVLAMISVATALALIAVLLLRTLILLLRSALIPWSLPREAFRRSESAHLSLSEPALWR